MTPEKRRNDEVFIFAKQSFGGQNLLPPTGNLSQQQNVEER
jgi:hypothetical protein